MDQRPIPLKHCPRTDGGQVLALVDHVEAHGPRIDCIPVRLLDQLGYGKFARAVDADEQV